MKRTLAVAAGSAAGIDADAGDEPAALRHQQCTQRAQFVAVARDIDRGAAAMRETDRGDMSAVDIGPRCQQCRGDQRIGGALGGGHRIRPAHLAVAARRETVEAEGRIALLLQKGYPAGQRAVEHVLFIASAVVQHDDDRERPRAAGFVKQIGRASCRERVLRLV